MRGISLRRSTGLRRRRTRQLRTSWRTWSSGASFWAPAETGSTTAATSTKGRSAWRGASSTSAADAPPKSTAWRVLDDGCDFNTAITCPRDHVPVTRFQFFGFGRRCPSSDLHEEVAAVQLRVVLQHLQDLLAARGHDVAFQQGRVVHSELLVFRQRTCQCPTQ